MPAMLEVSFGRGTGRDEVEAMLLGLHGVLRPARALAPGSRAAVEIRGDRTGLQLRLWLSDEHRQASVLRIVQSTLTGGTVAVLDDASAPLARPGAAARIRLGNAAGMLRTDLPQPGLGGLLAPLAGLTGQREACLQFVLSPARPADQQALLRRAREAEAPRSRQGWGASLVQAGANRAQARVLRDKAHGLLFLVDVRVGASSPALLAELVAAFGQFTAPYARASRVPTLWRAQLGRQLATRRLPLWPPPTLVSVRELASVLTPPATTFGLLPGIVATRRHLAPPSGAPRSGRLLAVADAGNERDRVIALSREDARLHVALIGPTGVGKSTVMARQVLDALAAGDGAVVLDPKGDLVEDLLRRLPDDRADDVIVLDPSGQRERPLGLNLLEPGPGQDAASVTEALMGVLRDLFARNWGARTDDTLYNAIFTAASKPGATLADLPLLLTSNEARRSYLTHLNDPFIAAFWTWFEALGGGERAAILAPALNKLRPLLRPDLAPIIGQRRSTLALDRVLSERRILLVRLPRDGALFGALLVARLWQAALRRVAAAERRRPDVLLAIDEVQSFLRTGGDLGEMLALARGLRLGLCLATQHLDQCPPGLRAALLSNARTRLVFQPDATDAAPLARSLAPELEAVDLTALGPFEVAARLAVGGASSRPFTGRTLPLPPPLRASSHALRAASAKRYGRPRREVEDELRAAAAPLDPLADAEIGILRHEEDA